MSGGIFNVGSFYGAGHPYLTGSVINPGQQHAYFFPAVTKRIQVQVYDNSGSNGHIRVHFAPDAAPNNNVVSNRHWWQVGMTANQSYPLDCAVKTKTLYISHDTGSNVQYQIFAELTTVSAQDMYILSGTGIDS